MHFKSETSNVTSLVGSANTAIYANITSAQVTATSAGIYANGAFTAANAAQVTATSAGIYANGAFLAANTASSDGLAFAIALG